MGCPMVSRGCPDTLDRRDTLGHYGAHGPQLRTLRRRRTSAVHPGGVDLLPSRQLGPPELRHRRRRRRGRHPRGGGRAASHRQRPQRPRSPRLRRPPELARRLAGGGERVTIAMPTLQTRPLDVLTVFNDIYAEAEHGRFYAYRSDRRHMWRLISRDEDFKPVAAKTVEELDAVLAAWLEGGARCPTPKAGCSSPAASSPALRRSGSRPSCPSSWWPRSLAGGSAARSGTRWEATDDYSAELRDVGGPLRRARPPDRRHQDPHRGRRGALVLAGVRQAHLPCRRPGARRAERPRAHRDPPAHPGRPDEVRALAGAPARGGGVVNDMPCLCAGTYKCNRCRLEYWRAQREAPHRRAVDNRLMALARDFDIDDDQWCVLMYLHVQDDLDLLLFQGDM